jgi:hypothetical protein
VGTVENALDLGAQGGVVWRALAFCKDRQFRHSFQRNGHGWQAAHPENYFRKTRMDAAIEFCGYRKVIEANPTDLRLQNFYRGKILSILIAVLQ